MPKPGMPPHPRGFTTESNHISRFPKNEVSLSLKSRARPHGKAMSARSSKTAGTTTRFSTS
ncbi:MAG: hypothetical protein ACLVL7_14440 [Anaerotruncus massiliensis (ex Togo et al. 2019)]